MKYVKKTRLSLTICIEIHHILVQGEYSRKLLNIADRNREGINFMFKVNDMH
jgi:hypothetical protein